MALEPVLHLHGIEYHNVIACSHCVTLPDQHLHHRTRDETVNPTRLRRGIMLSFGLAAAHPGRVVRLIYVEFVRFFHFLGVAFSVR